jgi:integrase
MKNGKNNSSLPARTNKPLKNQAFQGPSEKTRPQTRPNVLLQQWQENGSNMRTLYKPAKLYDKSKEWYVYYSYLNPETGKWTRFKERFNINRIHDLDDRRVYGHEMVKFINQKLQEGFNPFTAIMSHRNDGGSLREQVTAVMERLLLAASQQTAKGYRQAHARFLRWVDAEALEDRKMKTIRQPDVDAFQAWMVADGLASKTMKGTLSCLGIFWDEAQRQHITDANPWRGVKLARVRPAEDVHEPLTTAEMKLVFEHLAHTGQHGFATFLYFIYYAFARPIEICRLRVADIDTANWLIYFRGTETKSGKPAAVQIVEPMRERIAAMQLDQYPGDYYLFSGSAFAPGKAKKDSNKIGAKWRDLVRTRLGIDKSMYALKHTGNIDYMINNVGRIDMRWLQTQNRHASITQTEAYCRKLGAYFVDTSKIRFSRF